MALLEVFRNPADTGNGALNKAQIDAASLLATEGLRLEAGTWNVKALSGKVIGAAVGWTIAGAAVVAGAAPATTINLVATDGSGGSVVACASSGMATGIIVRDLSINGGRALGGWGTQEGACINIAGQNDYPAGAGRHNVQIINCRLVDGFTQQCVMNSVKGYSISGTTMSATVRPTVSSHGFDNDSVVNEKNTCFGAVTDCTFDSYGQECLKHENSTDITYTRCTFLAYVTLVQDQVDVYGEFGRLSFVRCSFVHGIGLSNLKRRRIPGSTYTNKFPSSKTCTLSGTNTVGGTVTSPGSGGGAGEYQFASGDVGQMVGYYSGQGTGAAIINSINAGTGAITSATVVTVFSNLTLPSGTNKWVIAGTDNSGDGTITWQACDFGSGALILGTDASANGYGALTVSWCTFSAAGNSVVVPSGVTVTATGCLNYGLPVKRFARPTADPKYTGSNADGSSAGANSVGPIGYTGGGEYTHRGNCTLIISDGTPSASTTAVGVAKNGDEVWALNGVYNASSSTNRQMNCGGKTILLRAESAYGAVIDGTSGGSTQAFTSSADPAGARIWGFVAQNWSGGSGGGFSITGGSVVIAKTAAINCTASNSGAGYRVSGWTSPASGAATLEDYTAIRCTASAGGGGGLYNTVAAAIFRRGVIRNCTATGNVGGGVRCGTNAGATFDALELYGNTAGSSGGGFGGSVGATLYNVTAYGNTAATSGADAWIANAATLTASSSIFYSADAGSVFPLANGTSGNIIMTNCRVQGVVSAGRLGNAAGTNSWGTPDSASPQFVDAVGGNLQLASASPARTAGVLRAGTWDAWAKPFATAIQGAWA